MSTSITFGNQKRRINRGVNLNVLRAWWARYRNRRVLREEFGRASPAWLSHMEQDIGLEPGSLQREMNKPFWAE